MHISREAGQVEEKEGVIIEDIIYITPHVAVGFRVNRIYDIAERIRHGDEFFENAKNSMKGTSFPRVLWVAILSTLPDNSAHSTNARFTAGETPTAYSTCAETETMP